MQIQQILQIHFYVLERATHGCLSTIASRLYADDIITEPVRNSLNFGSIMKEFTSKMELIQDMSELQSHCDLFLKCVRSGGPTDIVVKKLAREWGEVFHLAGSLSQTESFGSTLSPLMSSASSLSFSTTTSEPAAKQRHLSSTSSNSISSVARDEVVYFSSKFEEGEVSTSLTELRKSFAHLMIIFRNAFKEMEKRDNKLAGKVSVWLAEECMMWKDETADRNLDDIFKKICSYYDFIDCALIVDMSEEFLKDVTFNNENIVEKLKIHSLKAKALRGSDTICELKKVLEKKYEPYESNLENMPIIRIQLVHCWDDITIKGLYLLIKKMLPMESRQSIIKYISIRSGSVVIDYPVLDYTADSLIEYAGEKLQFMHLIGIFSLYINDHAVLQEDENMNFTFELALLEAVTAGHNEAVEFLLQLETAKETVTIDHTNEEGKTALMLASEKGHEDIVHSLISAGTNVNLRDNNGWTALMRAIRHNQISIISMLLNKAWLKLPNGPTEILMKACKSGDTQRVKLLLKDKVGPNATNKEGKTALMLACERGHEDIVHSLLSAGANANLQDNNGWTALMRASEHNHISIINMLLQANANPHLVTSDRSNALVIASFKGNHGVAELLISIGADYKYQREDGWNAFMLACQNGHTQIVELLLKEQVDPNVQNNNGWNAFMLACHNGHTQIVELLLKEQVDPNVQNNNGWNAFMLACHNGHTQIVEQLLKEQVDPNVQNNNGWNAFMLACHNGHTQIVELLLKEQVDPNVDRVNAFILACAAGHTQIVELLLKKQVDPNVQNKDGANAFMVACANGHTQIVELLLKEQVDPNVQNKNGVNAFMLACHNGCTQIVELLLKEQVDPNVQNNNRANAFMVACANGHTQIVELLLKEQVDPNVQNKDGANAFMAACQNGHTQIVELLLKEQVNPNVQNKNGYTALMVASARGHYQVAKLLLESKADPNIKSKQGRIALSFAKSSAIIEILFFYDQISSIEYSRAQKDSISLCSFVSEHLLDSDYDTSSDTESILSDFGPYVSDDEIEF